MSQIKHMALLKVIKMRFCVVSRHSPSKRL